MTQFMRCSALTLNPDFVVVGSNGIGAAGSTYKPTSVGEVGWMAKGDAEAAAVGGDVVLAPLNTPLEIENAVGSAATGQPFTTVTAIDGAGGLLRVYGGPSDQEYTFTISTELDGVPADDVVQVVSAGSSRYEAATLIAGGIPSGITLTADKNTVRFSPDGGETVTAFSVAIT